MPKLRPLRTKLEGSCSAEEVKAGTPRYRKQVLSSRYTSYSQVSMPPLAIPPYDVHCSGWGATYKSHNHTRNSSESVIECEQTVSE